MSDSSSAITHADVLPVLLVEDSLDEAQRLQKEITDASATAELLLPHFSVSHVRTLAAAQEHVAQRDCTVVLLDLTLPDSVGLGTLEAIYQQFPHIAVVILTTNLNDTLAIDAIRGGAQDYLIKGELTGPLLTRAVYYAAERQRLQIALAEARDKEQQQRDLHTFQKLSAPGPAPVSSRSFGQLSLRDTNPSLFKELVCKYKQLLEWSLEQIAYKVEHPVSEMCRSIAQQLGFIGAGPRDIVEIYLTALKTAAQDTIHATPQRIQAYSQEGKLIAFELMGNLVDYYRVRAVSDPRQA